MRQKSEHFYKGQECPESIRLSINSGHRVSGGPKGHRKVEIKSKPNPKLNIPKQGISAKKHYQNRRTLSLNIKVKKLKDL